MPDPRANPHQLAGRLAPAPVAGAATPTSARGPAVVRPHTGQDSQRFWASQSGWRGSKSRGPSPRGRRESEEGQGGMRGQQGTEDGHSKGGGTASAGGRAREIGGPPEGPGREGAAGERTQRQGNPGREHSGRPRAPSEANGVMARRHASQAQGHTEKLNRNATRQMVLPHPRTLRAPARHHLEPQGRRRIGPEETDPGKPTGRTAGCGTRARVTPRAGSPITRDRWRERTRTLF